MLTMLLTYLIGRHFWTRVAVPATLVVAITFVATQAGFTWAPVTFGNTKPFFGPRVRFCGFCHADVAIVCCHYGFAKPALRGYHHGLRLWLPARRGGASVSRYPKSSRCPVWRALYWHPLAATHLTWLPLTRPSAWGPRCTPSLGAAIRRPWFVGAIYIVIGFFGAAVTGVLTVSPKMLVKAIAGLALLGTIGSALLAAIQDKKQRDAALITFLVTLSGTMIAGVGSAFWGVVAGATALLVQHYRPRSAGRDAT